MPHRPGGRRQQYDHVEGQPVISLRPRSVRRPTTLLRFFRRPVHTPAAPARPDGIVETCQYPKASPLFWLHLQKMTMSRVMGLEPSRKSRLELTSAHGPSCLAVTNTMPSPKTSEQFEISSSPDPIPGPASRPTNLCCHGWRPQTDPAGGRRRLGLSTHPPVVHHTWR